MLPHYRLFLTILCLLLCVKPGYGQLWNAPDRLGNVESKISIIRSGIGWTRMAVNDTGATINYATLTLNPEFSIGKLKAGLSLNLLYNTVDDPGGSKFRQTDLKLARLIRYIRYGDTGDPWFVHAGALERVTLGHGFILSRYSNQIADTNRRIGTWFKIDRGTGGIEALVSNLSSREIYGARAFMRPAYQNDTDPNRILNNLMVGVTIVIDDDPSRDRTRFEARSAEEVGIDIEVPLVKKSYFSLTPYGDFAKILDSGSGGALGLRADFPNVAYLLSLSGRLEHQVLGAGFIPAFFDETYEVYSTLASGQTRTGQLQGLPATQGYLVRLDGLILKLLQVSASYRAYYKREGAGVFHAEAHLVNLIPRFTLHGIYDRQNVGNFRDLRTLDPNTIAIAEARYQLLSFLSLGVNYSWTFAFDNHPDVNTYRPLEQFTPKVMFEYGF